MCEFSSCSIGDVAELTGVATSTLRAWESRYDLVAPARTASAHRSYSNDDVEVFRRMRVLVDSAVPARRAARMAADPASVPTPSGLAQEEVRSGSPLSDHEALTRIAVQFDPVALQRTLDEAFSLASGHRGGRGAPRSGRACCVRGRSCCERGARRHAPSSHALRGCPARPYGLTRPHLSWGCRACRCPKTRTARVMVPGRCPRACAPAARSPRRR
jgi:DNA-binding transcriptional MerR regulator